MTDAETQKHIEALAKAFGWERDQGQQVMVVDGVRLDDGPHNLLPNVIAEMMKRGWRPDLSHSQLTGQSSFRWDYTWATKWCPFTDGDTFNRAIIASAAEAMADA